MRGVVVAAVAAVAFWALKPVFIAAIGDRAGYNEVFLTAGTVALLTSLVVASTRWRRTMQAFSGPRTRAALGNAMLSGVFLGAWYYGFYRALQSASMVDATIISFTWPLIAVVAMRVFSPATAKPLKVHQWALIGLSFLGAVGIAVSGSGADQQGSGWEIGWAFVAALGSGLYLPFAIRATAAFEEAQPSKPWATFYSISTANTTALAAVGLMLALTQTPLHFETFDPTALGITALIGVGTYLVAEIAWTWAFQAYESLTLSSLPYFSPAVSVVLLHLFFGEPVRGFAVAGLTLILGSNLALHIQRRSRVAIESE